MPDPTPPESTPPDSTPTGQTPLPDRGHFHSPEIGASTPAPHIPRGAHVPGALLLAAIWAAWLWHLPQGSMAGWGFSAAALAQGRFDTLVLHMFAHAGLMHIGFNSVVLFSLAGPLLTWMGAAPFNWLRFFGFYLMAGFAGAGLYWAINPGGAIPVVGASGAISGLIGLVSRLSDEHEGLVPLFSAEMGRRFWHFVRANLWLVLLFTVPVVLFGGGGGIAWEAHLGGFIAGLLGARWVLVDAHREKAGR